MSMKHKMISLIIGAAFAAPLVASATAYVGASTGTSSLGGNVCSGVAGCDDSDTGYKLMGGWEFNKNFAVEGSYVDLGEVSVSQTGASASAGLDGFNVAAVGSIPLAAKAAVFGKAGAYLWDANAVASVGGATGSASDSGTDLMFGIGAKWDFTKQFGARIEYEDYTGDADSTMISAGMTVAF